MNIYEKLQKARISLQEMSLTKTGHNKFVGYQYFELGDFIPQTQNIFNQLKLCGFISFGTDVATLTIVNSENPEEKILICSPMAEANLKGAHPIQNLGAVETYTRRYLWVSAMEIVEHDAIDAAKPDGKITNATPNAGAGDSLDQARKNYIAGVEIVIKDFWEVYSYEAMYNEYLTIIELDEKNYLWSLLDSKIRAKIKAIGQERKIGSHL